MTCNNLPSEVKPQISELHLIKQVFKQRKPRMVIHAADSSLMVDEYNNASDSRMSRESHMQSDNESRNVREALYITET